MVSIIILSYNTASLISQCLSSVFTHVTDMPFEVIVVDNHSHDQSVHVIKTKFPKVRVIESEKNLGFAKGVNLGASHAKGDFLLFLNSDTTFSDNALEKLLTFVSTRKNVAVVGGKLENTDGSTSSSYNDFYTLSKIVTFLFFKDRERRIFHKPKRVDWVSGGFMLIKKDLFEEINGFDDHYFMYIEDMDLCFRLSKLGYEVFYLPEAVVSHVGQGSSNRTFAIVQIYKGLLYFYKKHMPGWQYWVVRMLLSAKATMAYVVGIITGNTYLKETYSSALKNTL